MAKGPNPDSGLTDESRAFVVTQFAMHLTPLQVADAVNAEFGLSMTRQQVNRYNPESMAGRKMAPKWKKLFAEMRAKFLDEVAAVPMANRNARLKQLQIMYDKAMELKNHVHAASLLEQIAKEVGNVHSNERTINHKGKIGVEHSEMSTDEKRNLLIDRLTEAMEKAAGQKANAPGSRTAQ